MRIRPVVLFAFLGIAMNGLPSRGDAIYEVISLGDGSPVALNDVGNVVLNSGGQVVLWSSGLRQTLYNGSAVDLNNRGDVAGRTTAGHAVLFRSGAAIDLGIGAARALNGQGVVLVDDGDTVFTWKDGVTNEIEALVEHDLRAMNDAGWVVGNTINDPEAPFVYDGSTITKVRVAGFASDINSVGAFVYTEFTEDGNALYLRQGTTTTPLGLLSEDDPTGQVFALNDSNQIVGGSGGRGFLWVGGVMIDLNDLLIPEFRSRWTIISGIDINATGDIVAVGYATGSTALQALLLRQRLSPAAVPEPSTGLMAAVGIGLGALVMRRRRVAR